MLNFNEFMDLQEGVNDPAIFKAIFLAGGPGAGKSFIIDNSALKAIGFKIVASDVAFEHAMKKGDFSMNPEFIFSTQGQEIRKKATHITGKKMDGYLNGRLGIVIDGTGKSLKKVRDQRSKLDAIGYDTAMIFVNTDLETAVSRDSKRARSLGRTEVSKMWNDVQKNIGRFQSLFRGNLHIIDNSDSANVRHGTTRLYRNISKWAKATPQNPLAKKWISSQRGKK